MFRILMALVRIAGLIAFFWTPYWYMAFVMIALMILGRDDVRGQLPRIDNLGGRVLIDVVVNIIAVWGISMFPLVSAQASAIATWVSAGFVVFSTLVVLIGMREKI